jgi:ATP-dependent helicase/nuclease subunit A
MAFTKQQRSAIETDGSNILISAGAGAGKTTVLSERVIRKLKQGVNIDDLIILTFTNAAAMEMRQRIKKSLEMEPTLSAQLSRLENARISTFDSFCLGLVKQYHYRLNLPSRIEIADSILWSSIASRLLDATMDEFYLAKTPAFVQTIDRFFDKGDEAFKDCVRILNSGLVMIPDADDYLQGIPERMFDAKAVTASIDEFATLLSHEIAAFKTVFQTTILKLKNDHHPKTVDFTAKLQTCYEPLFTCSSLDAMISAFKDITHPKVPAKSKEYDEDTAEWVKQLSLPLKSDVTRMKKHFENLFADDTEALFKAMRETRTSIETIVKVTQSYRLKISRYQFNEHLFDFNDIMHLAIVLLEKNDDIRLNLQAKTNEIMVDEYQDTNDLQEYLVSLIANHNVFMVGDAKQSIYGFRNANPINFIQKYHAYKQGFDGIAIDLVDNFRSRKEVIDGINSIFETLMDESIGGIDYQSGQALVFGNHDYDIDSGQKVSYSPLILTYERTKASPLTAGEMEAKMISETIIKMIKNQTPVMDLKAKANQYHPAHFNDFCILVDRKSDFEVYESVFTRYGIPVAAIKDEDFIASTEILSISQVLKLIKCYRDPDYFHHQFKHAFYGVCRSFLYQFSDDAVISLFLDHPFKKQAELDDLSHHPIFKQLDEDMRNLSDLSEAVPIGTFMRSVMRRLKVYEKIVTLDHPGNVEKKLDYLMEKAASFRRFTFDDLIRYFEDVYASDNLDIDFPKSADPATDAVHLMSMHKSKGLEFPFIFYPGLDKKFNHDDMKKIAIFDKRYGLIIKAYDGGFKETLWHKLIRQHHLISEISERIRLFYVALTRTKEQFILLYNTASDQDEPLLTYEDGYLSQGIRTAFKNFHQFIETAPKGSEWKKPFISDGSLSLETQDLKTPLPVSPIRFETRIIEKVLVSKSNYSKQLKSLTTPSQKKSISEGTRLHRALENIDFHDIMNSAPHLSPKLREIVARFLSHPEIRNIGRAKVYQEYPFVINTAEGIKSGVIDLLVIYDDYIDIIDYKLKNLSDDAYRIQLTGYQEYIQSILKKPVRLFLYSLHDDVLHPLGGSHDPFPKR